MNWFARLFGLSQKQPTCFDIVSDYGAVIQTAHRSVSSLMDVSQLPYEKARIKAAILEAAVHLRDEPQQIEMLGMGFYMLGSFQNISTSIAELPDPKQLEAMNDEEFMRHIEESRDLFGAESKTQAEAAAEKAVLLEEWDKFINLLGKSNA